MKKLITISAMILLSLSSMSMGFPHNTYHQQKELTQTSTKNISLKQIENQVFPEIENLNIEEENTTESLIQIIANFVFELLFDEIESKKTALTKYNYLKINQLYKYSIKKESDFQYEIINS